MEETTTQEVNSLTPPEEPKTEEPKITQEQKVQAAVNDTSLAADEFKLGDKTYKIVDLTYDNYLRFVSMLSPLLDAFISKMAPTPSIPGIDLDASKLTVNSVMKYCGETLPEMVRIICMPTEPLITIDEIKEQGKNPFKLATVVLLQIARNNIIGDFADFFAQIAPLLSLMK